LEGEKIEKKLGKNGEKFHFPPGGGGGGDGGGVCGGWWCVCVQLTCISV